MRVLIDFDNTLFDTAAFRRALGSALAAWDINEERYRATEAAAVHKGLYYPDEHLQLLVPHDVANAHKAFASVMRQAKKFLYDDSIDFLQRQKMSGHQLTILSFGLASWQQQKIEHSEIPAYVDNVIVTDQPKEKSLAHFANEQHLVILDDRGSILDAVKNTRPDVMAIWIRRKESPYHAEVCKNFDKQKENLQFNIPNL